jgi:hypothetical protein
MLKHAVRALAAVCDRAHSRDHHGFNSTDTGFGHELAQLADEKWTPELGRAAWEMLGKYRVQLASHGIDFDTIPVPAGVAEDGWRAARADLLSVRNARKAREKLAKKEAERAEELARGRRISYVPGQGFVIAFPKNQDDLALVRALPRRRFEPAGPYWIAADIPANAGAISALVETHKFNIEPDAEERLAGLLDNMEKAGVAPVLPGKLIDYTDRKRFVIAFPYDPTILPAVKSLPGARFNSGMKTWEVSGTPAALEPIRSFAHAHGFSLTETAAAAVESRSQDADLLSAASREVSVDFEIDGLAADLAPHQKAVAAYSVLAQRAILADEEGLGAEEAGLAAVHACAAYPAIVIASGEQVEAWEQKVRALVPEARVQVLRKKKEEIDLSADVIVCADSVLTSHADALEGLGAGAVIMADGRRIANPKNAVPKAAIKVAGSAGMRLVHLPEGIPDDHAELVGPLEFTGRLEDFGGYWAFANQYSYVQNNRFGTEVGGSRDREGLERVLRSVGYISRTRAEVYPEQKPSRADRLTESLDSADPAPATRGQKLA